ncbi:molybdate ABC transporter substrate-binding protein [Pseudoflavonifractor sp. AF19-9AC]|uniref:molybdate ABC transporter substrate-binding protein n=1 Tax=Pseudoflavonifractor sp. AF19-9AC TaxID=2292244 RepID=UPI0026D4B3EA
MKLRTFLTRALALVLTAGLLAGCSSGSTSGSSAQSGDGAQGENVELTVFAAASMTETLEEIAELYKNVAPNVTLVFNFASSGDLLTQIKEGADCDLFISAAPKQMNAMDGSLIGDTEKNPDGLDLIVTDSRIDLLENKVALAVPEGNLKGIESFDQLAELLESGDVFLAMGNSDVPVGQYTQKIFAYYGLDEAALNEAGVLTYGSDVKEVTTQVSEGAVDCGIIYATDAFSANLEVVDGATAEMCGQVIYPAAVLKGSAHPDEAQAFLDYLTGDEAGAVFESVGFTPLSGAATQELSADLSGQSLLIYCGAGMQEPFQVIAQTFQDLTGCEMNVTYANAAQIQTQIQQAQEGAYFIAGSADEVKPVSDYVTSSVDLVKHIPVLAVAEGNPKNITGIADLASTDIVTVIGDSESTPIGKIAVKAFSDFGVTDQVNLAATTTTAPQLATLISLGEADAAIIWKENCNVDGVEICKTSDMDAYVKTIPAARLTFSADDQAADVFGQFLATDTAREIWTSFGYELAE